jgi:hypothetical protein
MEGKMEDEKDVYDEMTDDELAQELDALDDEGTGGSPGDDGVGDPDPGKGDDDTGTEVDKGGDGSALSYEELIEQQKLLEHKVSGLTAGISRERESRQQAEQQLVATQAKINKILEAVQNRLDKSGGGKDGDDEPAPLVMEFDENGRAVLHPDALKGALGQTLKPLLEKVEALEGLISSKDHRENVQARARAAKQEADKRLQSVLETDERYPRAMDVLRSAYSDLNGVLIEVMNSRGMTGALSAEQALDLIEGTPFADAWAKRHPGIDIVDVAYANESDRIFRRALRNVASTLDQVDEQKETGGGRAKKDVAAGGQGLAKKPMSPVGQPAGRGPTNTLEAAEALSFDELEGMSESDIEALMRELKQAEGGV